MLDFKIVLMYTALDGACIENMKVPPGFLPATKPGTTLEPSLPINGTERLKSEFFYPPTYFQFVRYIACADGVSEDYMPMPSDSVS